MQRNDDVCELFQVAKAANLMHFLFLFLPYDYKEGKNSGQKSLIQKRNVY